MLLPSLYVFFTKLVTTATIHNYLSLKKYPRIAKPIKKPMGPPTLEATANIIRAMKQPQPESLEELEDDSEYVYEEDLELLLEAREE